MRVDRQALTAWNLVRLHLGFTAHIWVTLMQGISRNCTLLVNVQRRQYLHLAHIPATTDHEDKKNCEW
jgi:hypothetical protein